MKNNIELAWAAGFFDGEGSTCWTRCHKDQPAHSLSISITQIDPEVLSRFQEAVGVGRIGGPYKRKEKTSSQYWQFRANNLEAHQALKLLWQFLSSKKRKQAEPCLHQFRLGCASGTWKPRNLRRKLEDGTRLEQVLEESPF